jgi:hypothetical protein
VSVATARAHCLRDERSLLLLLLRAQLAMTRPIDGSLSTLEPSLAVASAPGQARPRPPPSIPGFLDLLATEMNTGTGRPVPAPVHDTVHDPEGR